LSDTIRAVDRALDILICFSRQTPELNLTQISERVGMNKSTVHRLLGTLEQKRFLQRNPVTGYYRLGIRLLQMAYLTLEQNELRQVAVPIMHRLCDQSRETITLSALDGPDIVFLEVIESPQRVKLAASTGQKMPAFSTAAGKAILSRLPAEQTRKILAGGLQQFTPNTIVAIDLLLDNLEQARQNGFAFSLQEFEDGINAIAAPILDRNGQPVAAITVAGPAYRLGLERAMEIGPVVAASAREIGKELALVSQPGSKSE
jgi:IclR family acetate operon transcriptional repressor